MGNLDQILTQIPEGPEGELSRVLVTIVTNQDNGIVGYAKGGLFYNAGGLIGGDFRRPRLYTKEDQPLEMWFSDRTTFSSPPGIPQPFYAWNSEKLYVWISLGQDSPSVAVNIPSWGGSPYAFATDEQSNLLIGLGPSLGDSPQAVWVIAFTGVQIQGNP